MIRTMLTAAIALAAFGTADASAASSSLKRGIYSDKVSGCAALQKADPGRKLSSDEVIEVNVNASFLVIDAKSIGSVDFECRIGTPVKKGLYTQRALKCGGELSGGRNSTLRELAPGKIRLLGGLSSWGTVYFCR